MSKAILNLWGRPLAIWKIPLCYDASAAPEPVEEVSVTTSTVSNIGQTSATGGGDVTSGGAGTIRGICWNTSTNPTVADPSAQSLTTGEGSYSLTMSGLTAGTTYYVRAWAYNTEYFDYGDNVQFDTAEVEVPILVFLTEASTNEFDPNFSVT